MSHTPERKQYPVRGNIVNSSISVNHRDSKDKSFSQNSSLKGSFLSDGTCNFKPLVSPKPGGHGGDVPGLSKRYDPTARHQRKSTAGSNQGPMGTEFLSQNESLLKQIYDRQNQSLRYSAQQNLSYQHTGADMNISHDKNRLNQTGLPGNSKGLGEYEIPHNLTEKKAPLSSKQSVYSPIRTPEPHPQQSVTPKSGLNTFLLNAQPKIAQNHVRPMMSPHSATENEYYRADYQPNRSEEKKNSRIFQFQKKPIISKPRDSSVDSANCMDIDEHPQIHTNEGYEKNDDDEDLVIEFRGVQLDDTFSDPYTLTHRVEPLELVPEEESSNKYTSTSGIRSKGHSDMLNRSKGLSDNLSRDKLKVEDQETSKPTQPLAKSPSQTLSQGSKSQNKKKNDQTTVRGIVKATLDVDAIFKQAQGLIKKKKKSKKRREKTMSNKDSYSYYTESQLNLTNASQVIKEETEEESPQVVVEVVEIGSPKPKNDMLNYMAVGPDSKTSSPSVTDCQRPGSFMLQMLPTDRYETFGKPFSIIDASPVIRSPKTSDQGDDSKSRISETNHHTRNTAVFMNSKRDASQDSFSIKAQEDIAEMQSATQRNKSNESFISSTSQVPITNTERSDYQNKQHKSRNLGTPNKGLNTSNSIAGSLSMLTQQLLKPVGDIPKHFQQPQKTGQKQKQKQEVVKYELGTNAVELQTPNYAKAYDTKLKHAIRMKNGDSLPTFIKAKVTQGGRRVIRIHQDDQVGVDQSYDLVLNVYHIDTGIFDSQNFTLKIKAPKKLSMTAFNDKNELNYAIRGPSVSYPMPTYSVDEKRLSYSIEAVEGQVPSFVKIGTDEKGKPCIKLEGDNSQEKGSYQLVICAKDTVSGVVNRDAKFNVIGTQGIQIAEIPAGFDDFIVVKGLTSDKITNLPKFTVENEAELAFEILDENDQPSSLLQVKEEKDGLGIHLANDKGQLKQNVLQGFKLKVSQMASDAVQILPFKVFIESQQQFLQLERQPIPQIKYHICGKAIEIPVPTYVMKNGTLNGLPTFTISEKNGKEVKKVLSVVKDDQGNQMLRIFCQDRDLSGKYQVKFEATDSKSGINNDEAEFELTIAEPVLKLFSKPHSAFDSGTKVTYKPGNEPIYIPLPQYKATTRNEVKFRLTDKDGQPAPSFVKLETITDKMGKETKQIVIQGKKQPADACYDLNVHAYDEQTGSEQVHTISVQGIPASVNLKEFKVPKIVPFNVGQDLQFPLPKYSQRNHTGDLKLSLSDSTTSLARIEKGMIVINGGSGADQGTHEVTIIATEPLTGIQNREASFTLKVQAKLELEKIHKCFSQGIDVNIGDTLKLDLPQIKNSKATGYELKTLNADQPQDNVRIYHRAKGLPQLLISTLKIPAQDTFEMQLTITEKNLNITENLSFPVRFNLTPTITLLRQPDEIEYKIGDTVTVELPKYETYPVKNKALQFRVEGLSFVTLKHDQDAGKLFIQVQSDDESLIGKQTCKIIATDPETGVSNDDANLVVNVMPEETKIEISSPNYDFLEIEVKKNCLTPESKTRRPKGSRSKKEVNKSQIKSGVESFVSISEVEPEYKVPYFIIKCLPFKESLDYAAELIEYVDSSKPLPMGGKIDMASQMNEKQIRYPTPVYSNCYRSLSESDSASFQSDDVENQTLPDGVQHEEIQDPTNPLSTRKTRSDFDQSSSDEAISNMSKIVKQTEEVEYEDVIPTLAKPQHKKQTSRSQQVAKITQLMQHSQSQTSPTKISQQAKDNKTDESMHASRLRMSPEKQEYNPLQHSLLQFQQQLQTMQQLQHQQIMASQASHQLLLNQQKIAEQHQSQSVINQSFQQQNNSMNKAQIQQQLQQFLSTNQALFDQIKLQEDIDLNKQLKLQIQQSVQRRQQQQAALEQLQSERNHLTIHMANQNGRHIIDHTGQLQEKDQFLQQLKYELQQSWEQRSRFRQELNSLQQREDDLQAEIFFKDTQIKSTSSRNFEVSTKISETQFSIDRSTVFKPKEEIYEPSYTHVSTHVSKFDDFDIQAKVLSATKHLERLRLELEDLNGQIAKSEAHIEHDRMKVVGLQKQMNESSYSIRVPPSQAPLDSHRRYKEMPHSPVFEDVDETFMTEDLLDESYIQPQQNSRQVQHKITTPYRPKDNNIFGTPDEEIDQNDERARFTTTYTQFSLNQKFSGSKEGERGGLVLQKRKRQPVAPVSFIEDEHVAGMRSDFKQRKVEKKEKTIRDKINQSIMNSRPQLFKRQEQTQSLQVPDDSRRAKLSKMGQKLEQEKSKLVKMIQSSSTGNLMRYDCEQQLSVVQEKLQIVQGKLSRC